MPVFDLSVKTVKIKFYACLAQSVEHAAVNRSVGGPSPSTGAKQTTQQSGFFVIFMIKRTPMAMPLCYANDTAEPHWAFRSFVQAQSLHYMSGD